MAATQTYVGIAATRGRQAKIDGVAAILQTATPAGTIRETHLTARQLARIVANAAAILAATAPGAEIVGYVWCDHECEVHDTSGDPYGYGEACPGPHHPIYTGDDPT